MQLSFKRAYERQTDFTARKLSDLREGEAGVIEAIDLPGDFATRLMELISPRASWNSAFCRARPLPRLDALPAATRASFKSTAPK
jgi:hypothetical protein